MAWSWVRENHFTKAKFEKAVMLIICIIIVIILYIRYLVMRRKMRKMIKYLHEGPSVGGVKPYYVIYGK